MIRYVLLRLLRLLLAVWLIVSGIFLLSRLLSPAAALLPFTTGDLILPTTSAAEQRVAEKRLQHRLGLDLPVFYVTPAADGHTWQWRGLHNQYQRWLGQLLRGNLGRSYRDGQAVTGLLANALAYTLPLTISAALLAVGLAVWLSVHIATRPRLRQYVVRGLYVLDAVPLFLLGLLLLLLLANPEVLALFPAYGLSDDRALADASWLARVGSRLYHLILPVVCLVLVSLPALVVQLNEALQNERRADYATTARAKGLPETTVVRRHALRNALLPTITQLTNLLPALVAGAVVVEVIFALPGMGRLLADAAARRDYPVVVGGVLLTALVRLLAQALADWLYVLADPRIRLRA